jgi:hypothetical protein
MWINWEPLVRSLHVITLAASFTFAGKLSLSLNVSHMLNHRITENHIKTLVRKCSSAAISHHAFHPLIKVSGTEREI